MDTSITPTSPEAASQDASPTDLEIERFVQDMLVFVETRKAELGEQAAIDAFLDVWRESVADSAGDTAEAQPSAKIIPFPGRHQ